MLVIVDLNGACKYIKLDDQNPTFDQFILSVYHKFDLVGQPIAIYDKENVLIEEDIFTDVCIAKFKFFIKVYHQDDIQPLKPATENDANSSLAHSIPEYEDKQVTETTKIYNSALESNEELAFLNGEEDAGNNDGRNHNDSIDLFDDDATETLPVPDVDPLPPKKSAFLKMCPLCNNVFKDLSKHLNIHNIDSEDRAAILYSMRKRRSPIKNVKSRTCPYDDCKGLKPHTRLDQHLRRKHKLTKQDSYYRQIVNVKNTRNNVDTLQNKTILYSEFSQSECKRFTDYMSTLSGGNLKERESKQIAYKLRQILHGSNIEELNCILKPECNIAIEAWLLCYCKNNESSSAITYCSTWIRYLNFIKKKSFPEHCALIRNMIDEANDWKRPFRKMRSLKDKSLDQINVEEITIFRNGETFKSSLRVLESFKNGRSEMISRSEHSQLRNCLILAAVFRNAGRACALSNLTVSEFNNCISLIDEKYGKLFVVKVHNHKTVYEHGPAEVVLTEEHYELYLAYKSLIRPQLIRFNIEDGPESSLFLTWSGKSISSDDLIHGIKKTWASSGLTSKLTTTAIRKKVTTIIHKKNSGLEKELLATHLKHRLTTAAANYKEQTTLLQSLEGSNLVFESLGGHAPEPLLPVVRMVVDSVNDNTELENHSKLPVATTSSSTIPETESVHEHYDFIYQPVSSNITDENKKEKGNPFYTADERSLLNIVFNEFIECNRVPKLSTIRQLVEKDQRLISLVKKKKCEAKTIKGAIQNLVNKKLNKLKIQKKLSRYE